MWLEHKGMVGRGGREPRARCLKVDLVPQPNSLVFILGLFWLEDYWDCANEEGYTGGPAAKIRVPTFV